MGKTFLLKFYSLLLNSRVINDRDLDCAPCIIERISLWLLHEIIIKLEGTALVVSKKLAQVIHPYFTLKHEITDHDTEDMSQEDLNLTIDEQNQNDTDDLVQQMKHSLQNFLYPLRVLRKLWKTILLLTSKFDDIQQSNIVQMLIENLYNYILLRLSAVHLLDSSQRLQKLLIESQAKLTVKNSIHLFNEYITHTEIKPLFYRLLLHPGITEEHLEEFMKPIIMLANLLQSIELVVFFDEVNTSSCLALFKEMFMDRSLCGQPLPENIFFTAAINLFNKTDQDATKINQSSIIHRNDYLVHKLPSALEYLKCSYGTLPISQLQKYVERKIALFHVDAIEDMPFQDYTQEILSDAIVCAQRFCLSRLGVNSVSQREIERCFQIISFFWTTKYTTDDEQNSVRCITLAIAMVYYFRLPTQDDRQKQNFNDEATREEFSKALSRTIPDFGEIVQKELEKFVTTENVLLPPGVALNQAIKEHIFAIVVSVCTRTPLCIIGPPGQSKTLSFQIILQNLQGSLLSPKPFYRNLPSIDPFFCLGSKYSRPEEIGAVFERAIRREQRYEQNRINTRCVVFLDEAGLPDEKKSVLKVLHPYLDEGKVAFMAISNKLFDAANANRMMCIYRSLPSEQDQLTLAFGCLGLPYPDEKIDLHLAKMITGLCKAYREVLNCVDIPKIFHDRDFIYMLRELRFELNSNLNDWSAYRICNTNINVTPTSLLRALETNFNGTGRSQFEKLESEYRSSVVVLHDSMQLESTRRRLYGRYKLVIDESEDESVARFLFEEGILDLNSKTTAIFCMSDFEADTENELRNVEMLSTIKLCMESGKTIMMINTGRIHDSLYDVFNQNFSIVATENERKIFSKVAIEAQTVDCIVHEKFQCIVYIKRLDLKDMPPPFLSRFQKYSVGINDFYRIQLEKLPFTQQEIIRNVEEKVQSFVTHFGEKYFSGYTKSTIYSILLTLIKNSKQLQPQQKVQRSLTTEEL
ncbi:unnamed protein product, partial [Didymodactylos carnosus]